MQEAEETMEATSGIGSKLSLTAKTLIRAQSHPMIINSSSLDAGILEDLSCFPPPEHGLPYTPYIRT